MKILKRPINGLLTRAVWYSAISISSVVLWLIFASSTPAYAQGTIIDGFDVADSVSQVGNGSTNSFATGTTNLLGSEREITATVTSSGGNDTLNVNINQGSGTSADRFAHSQTSGAVGNTLIVYDGDADNGATSLDLGLGSQDFSSADAFYLAINQADLSNSGTIRITVYEDDTESCSSLTKDVPAQDSSEPPRALIFFFDDFTADSRCANGGIANTDFSDIDAIVVEVDGTSNFDMTADVFETITVDLGDLPVDYNITVNADDGAAHVIAGAQLDGTIDAETDGQESMAADGDDLDGTDDEDGVVRTPGVKWSEGTNGGSVDVTIVGGSGCLHGWIDWDNDNEFLTAGDHIIDHMQVSSTGGPNSDGMYTITFDIPSGTTFPDTFYARFRLMPLEDDGNCDTSASTSEYDVGQFAGGEVEDYQWSFGASAIDLISLTSNSGPHAAITRGMTSDATEGQLIALAALLCGAWHARRRCHR